jgi:hypothetical protein
MNSEIGDCSSRGGCCNATEMDAVDERGVFVDTGFEEAGSIRLLECLNYRQ